MAISIPHAPASLKALAHQLGLFFCSGYGMVADIFGHDMMGYKVEGFLAAVFAGLAAFSDSRVAAGFLVAGAILWGLSSIRGMIRGEAS